MRVFISYSSADGLEYAKTLDVVLKKNGHDSFFAEHDIHRGEVIWTIIPDECEKREICVFVITPSSVTSRGQRQEYDHIVSIYKPRMAFLSNRSNAEDVFKIYPYLRPPKSMPFSDARFEGDCQELSAELVRLKDKNDQVLATERRNDEIELPIRERMGLDSEAIEKYISILNESFQRETVIPEICRTQISVKASSDFSTIGIRHRLPRDWFLPYEKTEITYANDPIFSQIGREIALGERKYLENKILENEAIQRKEIEFSADGILEAVEDMRGRGFEPDFITTPIGNWVKMHNWGKEAYIKYSNTTPTPMLSASLVLKGCDLKIIYPLGDFPRETFLMSRRALLWNILKYPDHSAIYVVFGNDPLYPQRYVSLISGTTVNCRITPEGVSILRFKNQ